MKSTVTLIIFFLFLISCQKNNLSEKEIDPEVFKWKQITQTMLNLCDSINITNLHTATYFMYSNAIINGWTDSKTEEYFLKSIELINKKSYGLDYEWDAFQDGTVNSDTTNYTVTITDHVGLPFIEGYKNNFISKNVLLDVFKALQRVPLADTLSNGICYAYSDSPYDAIGCVHNVNINVAYFIEQLLNLKLLNKAYYDTLGLIIKREVSAYDDGENNFLYWDGSDRLTDHNHLCFQAWSMSEISDVESQKIANTIVNEIVHNREKTISSLIGYLRILPLNEFNSDSLYLDVEHIVSRIDTVNELYNFNYLIDQPRYVSQIAVFTARYYQFLMNNE